MSPYLVARQWKTDLPLRILLTTDAVGGVWQYTLSLASGLARAGSYCIIVVVGPAPSEAQQSDARNSGLELIHSGLPLDWVAKSGDEVSSVAKSLAALCGDIRPDVAHLHTPIFAAADWPVPVVAVAHSCVATWWLAVHKAELPADLTWRLQAMRVGLDQADAVIAPSTAFASALTHVYGSLEKLQVIYNGIEALKLSPNRIGRQPRVIAVGRLWDIGKNMFTLDSAAGLQCHAIMAVGEVSGPDGSHFQSRNLSIQGVLPAAALAEAFQQASIFVSPSIYEPFGLVVLEAAAAGLPLLLSDIPSFREMWDGAAVFLPPCNPGSWADAISSMMDNPKQRADLGEAAVSRSLQMSRGAMIAQTLKVHRSVAQQFASSGRL